MSFIKSLILFFVGLVLMLLVLEFFFKFAEIETPSITDYNQELGRIRRPNTNFVYFNEGFSMGAFNQYGYLGPGYPKNKESGLFRIALLGDSYVEGFQVFDRDNFRSIMEQNLSIDLDDSVQVLNFGRSGFDLADMYVYYEKYIKDFTPDLVILFLSNNDLDCLQTDPLIPKLIIRKDSLFITHEFIPMTYLKQFEKYKMLTQGSRLLQMSNNCRKLNKQGLFWPKILDEFYIEEHNIHGSNEYAPDINFNKLSLSIVNKLSENEYPEFVFVSTEKDSLNHYFTHQLYLNKLKYIELRDTLNQLMSRGINPNYWFVTNEYGHWNHEAHEAIGQYLSRKIIKFK